MLDLLKKLFAGDQNSSRQQANDRLRVVLTHDRLTVNADTMETIKEEILQVIARHIDIDGSPEVNLITEGRQAALDISIPLKGR
ncbi:MAG TPA: cell division topological specificity factor MinE [Syntrophomonas sp.]|nr:cell division topological specificity factor MinE [Syntrophomonas sp.]